MLHLTDDSGFMAIVDPSAYASFVDEDWSLKQLISHFKDQMLQGRILIWGTGCEGEWRVKVEHAETGEKGFREITGPITASSGRLLLTNYENLTMAAQFPDVELPEAHQQELLVTLASGRHTCRIVQLFDPLDYDADQDDREWDFLIELLEEKQELPAWSAIPWSDVGEQPQPDIGEQSNAKRAWWKLW